MTKAPDFPGAFSLYQGEQLLDNSSGYFLAFRTLEKISQNNNTITRAKPVTEIQSGPSVNIEIKPAAPARVRRKDCQKVRLSFVVVCFQC
jgi:hypothetical protein